MPVFNILAIKVTPRLDQIQPQPPLEEIIVPPETIVAADEKRAEMALARKIPEGTDLTLVKIAVVAIPVK